MTKAEVGDRVRIKHTTHKGKEGTVLRLERRSTERSERWPWKARTAITYVVDIESVGERRFPSSHFDVL